ncbi:SDR family NAD(P)-dependent oxidoreductase [Cohaesibacter sp. CAU 1516]|nr:SDR family NAD(P)-dependent oxidoreductase [Cohaesibacter sp. CAU 1516]
MMAEKTISTLGVTDWREERLPDLKGKIYVITGGNSGIGFEAARMLGEAGADVILACRSPEKAESARLQLLTTTKGSVSLVGLDLADTASVRAGAEGVRGMTDRIDGLINNAGIMHTPALKTKDGFELQFGTNHLGHFLWTALLLDLVEAAAGRVVAVSSLVHKTGKKTIDFDDLMLEKRYSRFDAYAQSKLANLMFAFELDRRLAAKGSPAIAVACHPGYSVTNLQTTGPSRLLAMLYSVIKHGLSQSAHFGARPTVLAAAGVEAKRGAYYGPTRRKELLGPVSDARVSSYALDQSVQNRLWQESEKLLGISFPA